MKIVSSLLLSSLLSLNACSQNKNNAAVSNQPSVNDIRVGGRCEDCDALYDCPESFETLNAVDTLPGFEDPGPKIEITGIIYQRDGKTPAAGVILYVYHTDQKGIYPKNDSYNGQHGYIRGWVKTGTDGRYTFYTQVPASYPNSNNPKHIHPIIKEPGKTEYWIDEYHFDDDPLLPESEKNRKHPVGSNGVLKPEMRDGMLRAKRDIVLGLNVRDYPAKE